MLTGTLGARGMLMDHSADFIYSIIITSANGAAAQTDWVISPCHTQGLWLNSTGVMHRYPEPDCAWLLLSPDQITTSLPELERTRKWRAWQSSDWRPLERPWMPAGSRRRPSSQSHTSETQNNAGTVSLLARIRVSQRVCVLFFLDFKPTYFKQIFGEILAIVQSFQVSNELCAWHPFANVLCKKKKDLIEFHDDAHSSS